MARTQRQWSDLRDEIRRRLRETTGSTSYWTDDQLIDSANIKKDEIEMQLQLTYEGFGVSRLTTDIVADQDTYSMPADAARIPRILRLFSDGSMVPLHRYERQTSGVSTNFTSTGDQYIPTFRFVDGEILLEPKPTEAITSGLLIEVEEITDRLSGDISTLPSSWPIFVESLLVLEVAVDAVDIEDMEDSQQVSYSRQERARDRYRLLLMDYINPRTKGIVVGERNYLGG